MEEIASHKVECHLLERCSIVVLEAVSAAGRAVCVLDRKKPQGWWGGWPPPLPGSTGAWSMEHVPCHIEGHMCCRHTCWTGEFELRRQILYSLLIQWTSRRITDLALCFRNESSPAAERGSQIFKDKNWWRNSSGLVKSIVRVRVRVNRYCYIKEMTLPNSFTFHRW